MNGKKNPESITKRKMQTKEVTFPAFKQIFKASSSIISPL